jgi:hypothetical protein
LASRVGGWIECREVGIPIRDPSALRNSQLPREESIGFMIAQNLLVDRIQLGIRLRVLFTSLSVHPGLSLRESDGAGSRQQ